MCIDQLPDRLWVLAHTDMHNTPDADGMHSQAAFPWTISLIPNHFTLGANCAPEGLMACGLAVC